MFDDASKPAVPASVEDIFAPGDSPRPAGMGPAQSAVPSPLVPRSGPMAPAVPLPSNAELMLGTAGGSRRGLLLTLMAGALLLLIGGVWWFMSRASAPVTPITNQSEAGTQPSVTPAAAVVPPAVVQPLDSDGDGLTDAQEQTLGTNSGNPDSDSDGLFDGEEVNVYHTNPLEPDSDHDSFTDGQEVHNGYNPLGPGKLLELPQNP